MFYSVRLPGFGRTDCTDNGRDIAGKTESGNPMAELRAMSMALSAAGCKLPLVGVYESRAESVRELQLEMSADMGGLFIDGLLDGMCISAPGVDADDAAESGQSIPVMLSVIRLAISPPSTPPLQSVE